MKFYTSLDAHEATTASGRPLIRGEEIDLSTEERRDPFNAHLIVTRQLIAVSSEDKAISDAQDVIDNPPRLAPLPAESGGSTNQEGGAES